MLTFAELVAPSCFLTTGFLSLDGSRVTAQQPRSLESRTEFRIDLEEGAGNAELGSLSLSLDPTAGGVDLYIVLIAQLDRLQRQLDLVLQVDKTKILLLVFIVDNDLAVSFTQKNPGNGFLTATNGVFLLFHLSERLKGECFGLLRGVRVLLTSVDEQFLDHFPSQAIFRQHAFNRPLDDRIRTTTQ